jgi:hypothetical protein
MDLAAPRDQEEAEKQDNVTNRRPMQNQEHEQEQE